MVFLLIRTHQVWNLWIYNIFGMGGQIMEWWQKLRHGEYSVSTPNDAKHTCRVCSILFRVLTEHAQFHCTYSAMIFTSINNCEWCVLGKYAKFCCAYSPSLLNFIWRTCRVHLTLFRVLAKYARQQSNFEKFPRGTNKKCISWELNAHKRS